HGVGPPGGSSGSGLGDGLVEELVRRVDGVREGGFGGLVGVLGCGGVDGEECAVCGGEEGGGVVRLRGGSVEVQGGGVGAEGRDRGKVKGSDSKGGGEDEKDGASDDTPWREMTFALHYWCTKVILELVRLRLAVRSGGNSSSLVDDGVPRALSHVAHVVDMSMERDEGLKHIPSTAVGVLLVAGMAGGEWRTGRGSGGGEEGRRVEEGVGACVRALEVLGGRWIVAKVCAGRVQRVCEGFGGGSGGRDGRNGVKGGVGVMEGGKSGGGAGQVDGASVAASRCSDVAVAAEEQWSFGGGGGVGASAWSEDVEKGVVVGGGEGRWDGRVGGDRVGDAGTRTPADEIMGAAMEVLNQTTWSAGAGTPVVRGVRRASIAGMVGGGSLGGVVGAGMQSGSIPAGAPNPVPPPAPPATPTLYQPPFLPPHLPLPLPPPAPAPPMLPSHYTPYHQPVMPPPALPPMYPYHQPSYQHPHHPSAPYPTPTLTPMDPPRPPIRPLPHMGAYGYGTEMHGAYFGGRGGGLPPPVGMLGPPQQPGFGGMVQGQGVGQMPGPGPWGMYPSPLTTPSPQVAVGVMGVGVGGVGVGMGHGPPYGQVQPQMGTGVGGGGADGGEGKGEVGRYPFPNV
ncbi:hypothetical protein HDV00_007697, partial [Rhizophlyctis rosea]